MMKKALLLLLLEGTALASGAQTLDECQQAARQNYPLIKRYDLISLTADLTVARLQTAWLPQVQATAQATYQSDVMAWPKQMEQLLGQMGISLKGLTKDQYRVGLDVSQTLYDGGSTSSQKALARQQACVEEAQNDVELYSVRQRVNELFFSLLLTGERLQLAEDLVQLLTTNEQKLAAMLRGGTAAESDYLAVKAERLETEQQLTTLRSQQQLWQRLLSALCGLEVTHLVKPADGVGQGNALPTNNQRPELHLLDTQLRLTDMEEQALRVGLRPRLSVFAQGYYGYPGYNVFHDMMHHNWSLNGMVGARLTWSIGALYTRQADRARLHTQRTLYELTRETFLFNNRLEQTRQQENMARYEQLMAHDDEIIALRHRVRLAAESRLSHGTADATDLLTHINQENAARISKCSHEIEWLKQLYDLKYTTNT